MNRLGTLNRPTAKAFHYSRKNRLCRGFTLAELMAVIGIVTVLSAILLPALNKGRTRSQAISCMNNLRQLQLSWLMFPDDHGGELPANDFVDGFKIKSAQNFFGHSWAPGNPKLDFTSANLEKGDLFQYNRNANIYRCPSDNSKVDLPTGTEPLLRTRSYSMSSSINSQVTANRYPTIRRQGELVSLNTSRLFVFIDTHEDNISDAHFAVDPTSKTWVNVPSDRHGRAANLSFADGHIERWKWEVKKVFAGWEVPAHQDPQDRLKDEMDLERLKRVVKQ
ncbi:MAG: prepilin-type N-terminal cleavage/methylation domain-containing protein [Limisphaerales bacterium]